MARGPRIFIPGVTVHVIHRGINRSDIFGDDFDRALFLFWFQSVMKRADVAVHAITLMTNHYHVMVTPPNKTALPGALKTIGVGYVQHFNRKYNRTGTLWNGRPRAIPIHDEKYWLTCLRYVELNPVRARMVRVPAEYQWSSYVRHAHGKSWDWLVEHEVYTALGRDPQERQIAYRALCDQPLSENDVLHVRFTKRHHPALPLRMIV